MDGLDPTGGMMIANQPLVIDNGSGLLKGGFAGDEEPKSTFRNMVGRPKFEKVMAGAVEGDLFVGEQAEELRGILNCRYALRKGVVVNWMDQEQIWHHLYNVLRISPEEHPVLCTEAPLNPKANREKMAEVFFETFNAPALFVCVQAVLALYASGRTTGVVVDSGDGATHCVPVYQGFALSHAIQRMDLAGKAVTESLMQQMRRHGHVFHTSAESEIMREMKEEICYVAYNPAKEESQHAELQKTWKLPDGQIIHLGAERFRAPELLFQPELVGAEYKGVPGLLFDSIAMSDLDLRKTLYTEIVLSGGSTMLPGFGDRLLNETRKLVPKDCKIRISAPPNRNLSTWVGGSILASLATFKQMWVTKQEYEEEGKAVMHRKTF